MSDTGAASRAAVTDAAVLALLRASLATWRIDAALRLDAGGAVLIEAPATALRITRAPPALPFRWAIDVAGRQRMASSVTGLLRAVRSALDPTWHPGRARVVSPGA